MPAQPSHDRHGLVTPHAEITVEECGFRMLEVHEIQRAMGFPDSYIITGSKRDKVKQLGNAVVPGVMEWLVERAVASLAG